MKRILVAALAILSISGLEAKKIGVTPVRFENLQKIKIVKLIVIPAMAPQQKTVVKIKPGRWAEVDIPGREIQQIVFKEYWSERDYEDGKVHKKIVWTQDNAKQNEIMNKQGVNTFRIGREWKHAFRHYMEPVE